MSKADEFRSALEKSKSNKSSFRDTALMMMAMAGHNVVTPSAISEPIINKLTEEAGLRDGLDDMIIALERVSPDKRRALIICSILKYLTQIDIMLLRDTLGDISGGSLAYLMEHPECCKDKEARIGDLLSITQELTGSVEGIL